MKTLKMKTLWLTIMVVAILGFAATPRAVDLYEKEKTDIKNDISSVKFHRQSIQSLKDELKANREADDQIAVNMNKRDLAKKKADLKRSKSYLKADKKDLVRDHRVAVKNSAGYMNAKKRELCDSEKQLKKDIADNNHAAIVEDAEDVAINQKQFEQSQAQLEAERNSMRADVLAVNEQIRELNNDSWWNKTTTNLYADLGKH